MLGEQYCRFWSDFHKLDTVIVRLFNTYGPGEHPGRYRNVIPNFLKLAMSGEPLPITGTGEETRDFNFVADTVEGMILAMEKPTTPADVFNLASGRETTIRTLAEAINEITGNRAGLKFTPRRGWDHVLTRRGDTRRRSAFSATAPKVGLREGLAATHAWLQDVSTGCPSSARLLLLSYAFPPATAPEAMLSAKRAGNLPGWDVEVIAAAPFHPGMATTPTWPSRSRRASPRSIG